MDQLATAVRVLGEIAVSRDGRPVQLGSARQRRLLAALLVHANEIVSTDRLVDVVWGDGLPPGGVDAPETRSARLHTLVSRLRATLADDRLETRPPGYRLRVGADELDALRFEECVRTGLESADRPEIAVAAFDDALSLWGGPPYAEFADEEFVVSEVARLLELHARAVEERAAALLQLDRPEDAVDQLESEILAQPFRERLRALSMLALARSGRAVESLRAYESFRVMLAEEIGVSPSAELQELNNEIARQDPAVSRSNVPETPASARGLPKGTLTFLFTDLESSTRLWEEHPQSMHEALARHDAILRDAIESHGGRVVKTTGDGALGVFESAHGALDAALAAQLALAEELWGENEALRVRMALHTGEAEERAGDYYGTAVNRAARLMSAGHGQQILTSQAAAQLMRDDLPPDVELIDLGVHRLRDVPTAERIFQVFHPDLPEHFPALLTVDGAASLPVPATSFHGRSGELAMLDGVLGRHGTVTLVGTGGVGKTRLAVEVAVQAGHQFRDGVAMVDLTPVGVDEVPATVAAGLGLVRRGRHSFRDSIVDWLRHKHFLLVIDNCEHVLPAAGQLVRDITETCAEVTVLATSRQPLGFSGETVFAVGPLELPSSDDATALEESSAVRMFTDRAAAARTNSQLDAQQLTSVAAICRRLDGIPLALELAAARARSMSLEDLLDHLDVKSSLLAASTPDHPRHRTLFTAIEWSYDMLEPESRELFARLSVFSGSWTVAAAASVCAENLGEDEVLVLLADLVDRSMLVADFALSRTRYRMLGPLRDFAADCLIATGELESRRARHADFYGELAQHAEPALRTDEEPVWVSQVAADFGNLYAAHGWAMENAAVDFDARLLVALWNHGLQRLSAEYFGWVEEALEKLAFDEHPLLADLHGIAALAAWLRGDLRQSMRSCRAAFDAEQRLELEISVPARMAIVVANAYAPPGNPALESMAAEAPSRFLEVVEWCRARDDPFWLVYSMVTGSLGMVMTGEHERAAKLADRALRIARQSGCPTALAWALFSCGTALEQSDPEHAERRLDEAVHAARSVDGRLLLGLGISLQATLRRRLGRPLDAAPLLVELIDHWDRLGDLPQLWHAVREAALCLGLLGEDAVALQLLGAVDGVELVMPLLPSDRDAVSEARRQLRDRVGDDAFGDAAVAGGALARDAAVQLAVRTLADALDYAAQPAPA